MDLTTKLDVIDALKIQVIQDILIENGLVTLEEFNELVIKKLDQNSIEEETKKEILEYL